jgi:SAM-dependent methyltransferase
VSTRRLASAWEAHAQTDPYWAIIPADGTAGGGWDVDAFFKSGEADVDGILDQAAALGLTVRRASALDFGCGVGRLTQALAARFGSVVGVDVSSSMLELARTHNRFEDTCRYLQSASPDLNGLPAGGFDFILSLIVLQHIPPRTSRQLMAAFVRVLAPGGVLAFQYTGRRRSRGRRVSAPTRRLLMAALPERVGNGLYRKITGRLAPIEMFGMAPRRVVALLEKSGGRVVAVVPDGSSEELESFRYFVTCQ